MAMKNMNILRGAAVEIAITNPGTYEVVLADVTLNEAKTGVRADGTSFTTKDTIAFKMKTKQGAVITHNLFISPVLVEDPEQPGQYVTALSDKDLFIINKIVAAPLAKQTNTVVDNVFDLLDTVMTDKISFKITLTNSSKKDTKGNPYFDYDYSSETAALANNLAMFLAK